MQLADPLDDTTWNNDNIILHSPIRSTFEGISQAKWDKIFGHKLKINLFRKKMIYVTLHIDKCKN